MYGIDREEAVEAFRRPSSLFNIYILEAQHAHRIKRYTGISKP